MEEKREISVRCIDRDSREYPEKLKDHRGMPKKLYVIGQLPRGDLPSAAVVGARMCSVYGRIQGFRFAQALSSAGVQVISGMATGIDSEAHKGAMEGAQPTFAVLGSGADICYPACNRPLYERILREGGGILSEYPPGTRARSGYFPARNRIISALADVVLVVEAREKSGSLITANWALEQGKAVYALPGPVNEDLSRGCHKLIYDGAGIAYKPEVLLAEWGLEEKEKTEFGEKNKLGLARDQKLVYSCLDLRPVNTDVIVRRTGLPSQQVNSLLVELELLGLAREAGRRFYVKQE